MGIVRLYPPNNQPQMDVRLGGLFMGENDVR